MSSIAKETWSMSANRCKTGRELAAYFEEKVTVGETERVSSLCVNRKMKRVVMEIVCHCKSCHYGT